MAGRRPTPALGFATLAVLLLALSSAQADEYWTVSSGDWSAVANWGGVLPTSLDTAYVVNGGTATVTLSGETCSTLSLGGTAGTGTLQMTGGDLSTASEYLGYAGTGSFTQSDGTNNVSWGLYLGYGSGSSGTYSLNGGGLTLFSGANLYVGYSGTGSFTQSDGNNNLSWGLYLGYNPGSNGTYSLSGGQLWFPSGASLYVGYSGTGNFTQSGGNNTAANYLYLGYNPGSSGTYGLSNTGVLSAQYQAVGYGGTGAFTQCGGNNTPNYLYLGYNPGSSGTYGLSSSGFLSAQYQYVGCGGTGSFTQSGGTDTTQFLYLGLSSGGSGSYSLTGTGSLSTNTQYVGCAGTGSFTQSGGTDTNQFLYLGLSSGGSGTYGLSSTGSLSAQSQYLGYSGTGSFTQSGGTNNAGNNLYLAYNCGSNGTYSLNGTGILSTNTQYVGYSGTGSFTQSGGNNAPNSLYLGYNPASSGTYNLSDPGVLSTNTQYVGYGGTGSFTQSGGSNTASNALYLGYNPGSTGTYIQSGGTNTANVLYLGFNSGGSGTYNLSDPGILSTNTQYVGYSGTGSFTQSGGSNAISYALYLGDQPGSSGTYSLSGGSLSLSNGNNGALYVGYSGTGSFTQSGGTNTLSTSLYLGYSPGGSGTYSLGGGSLSLSNANDGGLYVGYSGTGSFTQSGGTNTASNALYLGDNPGGSGTYSLSGTGFLSAQYQYLGCGGTGSFTQSGGTNTVSTSLYVGFTSGGSGTYSLSGGSLSVPNGNNGGLFVGYSGTGSFTQSGGTNTVYSLVLGSYSGSSGTYNLNGGTLIVSAITAGAGTAAFNLNGGTLQAGATFSTGVPIAFAAGGSGTVDTAGYAVTLSGQLSGPGGLIKADSGTLTLAASNIFTGNTLVGGGTLTLSNSGALQQSTLDTSGAGVVSFGSLTAATLGGLTGPGALGLSNTASAAVTLSVGNNNSNTSYSGTLSGTGGFAKIGTGALALSGSNTYAGGTSVNSGTLLLDFSAAGAPASNIINYSADSSALTLGGGTLSIQAAASGPASTQRFDGLTLAADASTIQLSGNGNSNVPILALGPITATAAGSALLLDTSLGGTITTATNKDATGIYGGRIVYYDGSGYDWATTTSTTSPYTLSKAVTTLPLPSSHSTSTANYLLTDSGAVTVSETVNTLKITTTGAGSSLTLGSGQSLTLAAGGLLFTGSNDYTISGGAITAGNGSGGYDLIVQQYAPNNNLTIASAVTNNAANATSLTKAGPGTLTLSAANNSYSGGTTVLTGTLALTGGLDSSTVLVGYCGAASFTQPGGVNTINNSLYLGYNPGGSGTYSLGGTGALSAWSNESIGYSGTGSFTQSGGNNNIFWGLYLGYNPGSSGTYNLSGTGSLSAFYQYLGYSGTGSFTQSGGTNNASWGLYLGYNPGSSGAFTQSGGNNTPVSLYLGYNPGSSGSYSLGGTGALSSWSDESVGYSGTGSFTQSGGSNTVPAILYLGCSPTGSGTYNLSGTGFLSTFYQYVGYSGTGSFTQSGGTSTADSLILGNSSGSSGTYSLSGAGLLAASFESVGYSGTGSFTQSGGTNTVVGGGLYLAYNPHVNGTYSLTAGSLSAAGGVFVGYSGSGTFTQSGGTNTVSGNLYLGYNSGGNGFYNLSGPGVLSACCEYVGYATNAAGIFQQTGGMNTVSYLSIGGGDGRYLLNGGTLQVNGGLANAGDLDFGGGVLSLAGSSLLVDLSQGNLANARSISLVLGPNSLLILPSGFDPSTAFAAYSNAGMTHTAGTTLVVPAGQGFGGWGSINDPVNCQGTIAAGSGGFLNLTAGLTVSGTGTVNLGSGSLTVNASASQPSISSIAAGAAASAGAVSIPTGGELAVDGALSVSGSLTSAGILNFNAGAGGTVATLVANGGATTLAGSQSVATASLGAGSTFSMSGGSVGSANLLGGAATLSGGTIGTVTLTSGVLAQYGGQINNLAVSGGTATLGSGLSTGWLTATGGCLNVASTPNALVTAVTADFSAGSPAVNTSPATGGRLAITSQLRLPGPWGLSGAFVVSGSNLADNTASPRTLTLTGGRVTIAAVPGTGLVLGGGTLGSYSYSGGTWTVSGAGSDMWDGIEQSYFVFRPRANASFDVSAYVNITNGPNNWTKAGIMAAGGTPIAPAAPFIFVAATPTREATFQWSDNLQSVTGGSNTADWLRLAYNAATSTFTGYYSTQPANTNPASIAWTQFGQTYVATMPGTLELGLMVTSHVDQNTLATADFTNVGFMAVPTVISFPATAVTAAQASTLDVGAATSAAFGSLSVAAPLTLSASQSATPLSFSSISATATGSVQGGTADNAQLVIRSGGTVDVAASQTLTVGVPLVDGSSATTLVKSDSGTLVLTAVNTYSGGTSLVGGVLAAENAAAIPSGSLLAIGPDGSLALGTPGAMEPLGLPSEGAGPLVPQPSTGGTAQVTPTRGGGVNPVPEPGTLTLLAAAAACGLRVWRRRSGPRFSPARAPCGRPCRRPPER